MQEPTLVILAAGMGSRFGGLKQISPVDDKGQAIIDFSLFDAYRAGFRKVAFIIKHEIEEDFKAAVGRRMERFFDVKYVYQELDKLPAGYSVPEGRVKPWGTGHALLCCKGIVEGPFAVINADDFYGPSAYTALYSFLTEPGPATEHAMIAYLLKNTVTEHGSVARGVCSLENGLLTDIVERTRIVKDGDNGAYTGDGETWLPLPGQTPVSMNCWGFKPSMLDELEAQFAPWLAENISMPKAEYFLPSVASGLISQGRGRIRVLPCVEQWHGITYREDLEAVVSYIADMKANGVYPEILLS